MSTIKYEFESVGVDDMVGAFNRIRDAADSAAEAVRKAKRIEGADICLGCNVILRGQPSPTMTVTGRTRVSGEYDLKYDCSYFVDSAFVTIRVVAEALVRVD